MERLPRQTLNLIGISGATGLGSILVGNSKSSGASSEASELQKELGLPKPPQAQLDVKIKGLQAMPSGSLTQPKAEELAKLQESFKMNQSAIDALEAKIAKLNAAVSPAESYRGGHAWCKDIVSDSNGLSFHRFQAVLWTLILGIVFVTTVLTRMSMPEFETTLLTLMGISHVLYLGFKIPEK